MATLSTPSVAGCDEFVFFRKRNVFFGVSLGDAPVVIGSNMPGFILQSVDSNGFAFIATPECGVSGDWYVDLQLGPTDDAACNPGVFGQAVRLFHNGTWNTGQVLTLTCLAAGDTMPPLVSCKTEVVVELDGAGKGSLTVSDIASNISDASGISDAYVVPSDFTCADLGSNTVTLFAVDAFGNIGSDECVITVEDNINPTITCPSDVFIEWAPVVDLSSDTLGAPVVSDNCGISDVSFSDVFSDGLCEAHYFVTRIWTVTDTSGNTNTCSQEIEVRDTTPPTVVCASDVVITLTSRNTPVLPSDIDGGSSDVHGIHQVTVSPSTFGCGDVGPQDVVLTVIDVCQNAASDICSVTVEYRDTPDTYYGDTITARHILDIASLDNGTLGAIQVQDNAGIIKALKDTVPNDILRISLDVSNGPDLDVIGEIPALTSLLTNYCIQPRYYFRGL